MKLWYLRTSDWYAHVAIKLNERENYHIWVRDPKED